MTLPRCPRCATPVEPDWDWCRQCGYDPDGLRPEGVEIGATGGQVQTLEKGTRRSRQRGKKKTKAPEPREALVEERPPPPRKPVETVYGLLPYDHPSSVVPLEPEEPDRSEELNRRFAIISLCVIVVGLALLVAMFVVS